MHYSSLRPVPTLLSFYGGTSPLNQLSRRKRGAIKNDLLRRSIIVFNYISRGYISVENIIIFYHKSIISLRNMKLDAVYHTHYFCSTRYDSTSYSVVNVSKCLSKPFFFCTYSYPKQVMSIIRPGRFAIDNTSYHLGEYV